MSEMLDKMKELAEAEQPEEEVGDPMDLLTGAIDRAIEALETISIYGQYGRSDECAREAVEAGSFVKRLKMKYDEQVRLIEILKSPANPDYDDQ